MCKFKKIILCVLSLVILLSAFPSTVYAESSIDTECSIFYVLNDSVFDSKFGSLPLSYTVPSVSGFDSYRLQFSVFPEGTVNDEGSLSLSINLALPSGFSYSKVTSECFLAKNNEVLNDTVPGIVSVNGSTFTANFNFNEKASLHQVSFYFENISFSGSRSVSLKSSTYEITTVGGLLNRIVSFFSDLFSRLTSWFDNLFQWLKDIRDGNISFSESVKTLFSNITDNIRNFFNDLGNKLKDGIDNVGTWFSEIGDRISGFFSDLWNNIILNVESITDSISDWWQSVKDFFHSLFVPEDGYFDTYKENWESWAKAHFGFFYDATELVDNLITRLDVSFSGSILSKGRFYIPEIRLPFLDKPVILKETTFHLYADLIIKNTQIKWVYNTYQLVVTALSFFFIIKFAINTFNQVIGERE